MLLSLVSLHYHEIHLRESPTRSRNGYAAGGAQRLQPVFGGTAIDKPADISAGELRIMVLSRTLTVFKVQ